MEMDQSRLSGSDNFDKTYARYVSDKAHIANVSRSERCRKLTQQAHIRYR